MDTLSPTEYEQLVAGIVAGMRQSAPELAILSLGAGRTNRIHGASGYNHQIDVSLTGSAGFFLLECKKWNKRVGVESVLVLAARASDILQANCNIRIIPILVSSIGFTRGAQQVARHCEVLLELVQSPKVFGIQLGARARIGVQDSIAILDHVETRLYRDGKLVDG